GDQVRVAVLSHLADAATRPGRPYYAPVVQACDEYGVLSSPGDADIPLVAQARRSRAGLADLGAARWTWPQWATRPDAKRAAFYRIPYTTSPPLTGTPVSRPATTRPWAPAPTWKSNRAIVRPSLDWFGAETFRGHVTTE